MHHLELAQDGDEGGRGGRPLAEDGDLARWGLGTVRASRPDPPGVPDHVIRSTSAFFARIRPMTLGYFGDTPPSRTVTTAGRATS